MLGESAPTDARPHKAPPELLGAPQRPDAASPDNPRPHAPSALHDALCSLWRVHVREAIKTNIREVRAAADARVLTRIEGCLGRLHVWPPVTITPQNILITY